MHQTILKVILICKYLLFLKFQLKKKLFNIFKLDDTVVDLSQNSSNQLQIAPIKLSNAEIASRNITKMVLFMLLIYYIGYLPFLLYSVLIYISFPQNTILKIFSYFAILSKESSKSITIFIYYSFNKEYKKKFNFYLKKILRR
jgi:hypothetical protein